MGILQSMRYLIILLSVIVTGCAGYDPYAHTRMRDMNLGIHTNKPTLTIYDASGRVVGRIR